MCVFMFWKKMILKGTSLRALEPRAVILAPGDIEHTNRANKIKFEI